MDLSWVLNWTPTELSHENLQNWWFGFGSWNWPLEKDNHLPSLHFLSSSSSRYCSGVRGVGGFLSSNVYPWSWGRWTNFASCVLMCLRNTYCSNYIISHDPWGWYVYLHERLLSMANVGNYTSAMDRMGMNMESKVGDFSSAVQSPGWWLNLKWMEDFMICIFRANSKWYFLHQLPGRSLTINIPSNRYALYIQDHMILKSWFYLDNQWVKQLRCKTFVLKNKNITCLLGGWVTLQNSHILPLGLDSLTKIQPFRKLTWQDLKM